MAPAAGRRQALNLVIPAKAGIQRKLVPDTKARPDSRVHGNDRPSPR